VNGWTNRRKLLAGLGGIAGSLVTGGGVSIALGSATGSAGLPAGWPMGRHDPAGTGYAPEATGPAEGATVVWQRTVGTERLSFERPAPVVADDTVVVAGEKIATYDAESGRKRGRINRRFRATPAVVDTGVYGSPTVVCSADGGAVGLDPAGDRSLGPFELGSRRWRAGRPQRAGPVPGMLGGGSPTPPVATEEAVVVSEDDLVAIDPEDGTVRWRVPDRVPISRPAVRDGTAYVSMNEGIEAVDLETGDRERVFDHGRASSGYWRQVTAGRDRLYLTAFDGVAAVGYDGELRWKYAPEYGIDPMEPPVAVAEGLAFVPTSHETAPLVALDAATGSVAWQSSVSPATGNYVDMFPAIADGRVYLRTEADDLAAVDLGDGSVAWRFEPPEFEEEYDDGANERILSAPVLAKGRIYALGQYRLYALEEP
jgi:outer membrane protein assembly factor BamB